LTGECPAQGERGGPFVRVEMELIRAAALLDEPLQHELLLMSRSLPALHGLKASGVDVLVLRRYVRTEREGGLLQAGMA
jgi:hypothetical protein